MIRIDDTGEIYIVPPQHSTTQFAIETGRIRTDGGRVCWHTMGANVVMTADELDVIALALRAREERNDG